ncbi:MAG: U32 family peptidase [Coriobacteriia bacterium]|nr:U32 family peptidase [Coriobacteriia bacterium]
MKNYSKIELLAPAGGPDQLRAAVNFGADAVYLAAEHFGMRAKAENFTKKTLAEGIKFAHDHNVKVYVTCNILMHDEDVKALRKFVAQLAEAEADAVIVGDLGAMATVKELAPALDIHVSTQASVANTSAAIEYAKLGAKRIILAREMSLAEIAKLRKNLDAAGYKKLDLEAFVHGAMCMSVSGRCLISSYLTGRSANKGLCTQPCRWGYKLIEEKRPGQDFEIGEDGFGTYIMNSKDMNMLAHIGDLKKAGLTSLKIEGRNKKALYVATVVNAYRHVLNGEDPEKWAPELEKVSHRPYSTGFYFGQAEQSPDYDGYEQDAVHVGDVLDDGKILCRNHFEEGETIEALIPGGDVQKIKVSGLTWFPDAKSGGKATDVANRATEIYAFATSENLPAGTLLRSKTFLRTSRQ